MTKFEKTSCHRTGLPFWDNSFSANLVIKDSDGKRVWCLGAFELLDLKKLLNTEFDGRLGQWKEKKD